MYRAPRLVRLSWWPLYGMMAIHSKINEHLWWMLIELTSTSNKHRLTVSFLDVFKVEHDVLVFRRIGLCRSQLTTPRITISDQITGQTKAWPTRPRPHTIMIHTCPTDISTCSTESHSSYRFLKADLRNCRLLSKKITPGLSAAIRSEFPGD